MAKVCEMIVNRDYIRENNAGHPPRLIPRARTSPPQADGGVCAARACVSVCVCVRACIRAWMRACVRVYAGAMLSRTCVEKKRPGGRGWTGEGVSGREGGRRYFFTRNERVQGETCIRLAGGSRGGGG